MKCPECGYEAVQITHIEDHDTATTRWYLCPCGVEYWSSEEITGHRRVFESKSYQTMKALENRNTQ